MKNTRYSHLNRLFLLDHQYYLKQVLLFAVVLFLSLTGVIAQNKVWYVATTGSDSSSGSLNAPLRSISKAISLIVDGDTIMVRKGVYSDALNFGTKLFVLKSESGADSTRVFLLRKPSSGSPVMMYIQRQGFSDIGLNNQIYGFTFVGDGISQFDNIALMPNSAPYFFNCSFEKFVTVFNSFESAQFQNCIFRDNGFIESRNASGIDFIPSFINCTFDNNGRFNGVATLFSIVNVLLINCILNYDGPIFYGNGSWLPYGLQIFNSIVNDTVYSKINGNSGIRPSFLSNSDYRLKPNSNGIGMGLKSYVYNNRTYTAPGFDLDGNPRPNPSGSRPDVGAYESVYALPAPELEILESADRRVIIRWKHSASTTRSRYKVFRSTSPIPEVATNGLIAELSATNTISFEDTIGLTNLTKYFYRLKVVDSSGIESGFSNELSVRPNVPPAAVTNIVAESGPASILLKWKSTSNAGIKYSVYRSQDTVVSNASLLQSAIVGESYLDAAVTKSVAGYYYWIKAIDSVGAVSEFSKYIFSKVKPVWYVATTGSDSSSGSLNAPLRSISKAISKMMDGDTIMVKKGSYSDSLNFGDKLFSLISESGADSTAINLLKIPGVLGMGLNICMNLSRPGDRDIEKNSLIQGFLFKTISPIGAGLMMFSNLIKINPRSAPIFNNCLFIQFSSVFDQGVGSAQFKNCVFRDNLSLGRHAFIVDTTGLGYGPAFINCTFDRNQSLQLSSAGTPVGNQNILFFNSIFTYTGSYVTYAQTESNKSVLPSGLNIVNSIVDDTVYSKINGNSGIRPSFISSTDYRLKPNSNGIGMGLKSFVYNNMTYTAPGFDFDGNPRPNPAGSSPDLGAYESAYSIPTPGLELLQRNADTTFIKWSYYNREKVSKIILYRDTTSNIDTLKAVKRTINHSAADLYLRDTLPANTIKNVYYGIKVILKDGSISTISNIRTIDITKKASFIPPMINATYAWGDIDSDGDMDLAVMGNANEIFLQIYKNNDTSFVELLDRKIAPQAYKGTIKFADIDNDGDIDLFVSGQKTTSTTNLGAFLFKNDGKGNFTSSEVSSVIATREGDAAFGDHDNDGDLDLALSGIDAAGNSILKLYNNAGTDIFSLEPRFFNYAFGPNNISYADIAWVDYDNDGDQDLLYTGVTSMIYGGVVRNTLISDSSTTVSGNQVLFSDFSMKDANFDLADLNGDGNVDMVISGSGGTKVIYNQNIKQISMNLGSVSALVDSVAGKVKLADYDNDGDIDILIAGIDNLLKPRTVFLINQGNGVNFIKKSYDIIPNLDMAGFSWADYDNDGDLDLVISGQKPSSQGGNVISEIYSFEPENRNIPPSKPKNVTYQDFGDGRILMKWDPATDDLNPAGTLNYLVKIGSISLGGNIGKPFTVVESNSKGGNLLNPESVLVYSNKYFTQLNPGKYYALIQSVDYNKLTSGFSDTLFITLTYPWKIVNQGGIVDGTIGGNVNFSAKWSDIDRDNDYDFIYGGTLYESNGVNYRPSLYQNNATGLLNSMVNPNIKWNDLNQDGIPDLIVSSSELITPVNVNSEFFKLNIFLNDTSVTSIDTVKKQITAKGKLVRANIPSADTIYLGNSRFKISDINNDGKPEILFAGRNKSSESRIHVFSTGTLPQDTSTAIKFRFNPLSTNLDSILLSEQSADLLFDFGDIDRDNDNDFIAIYKTGLGKNLAKVFLNKGVDTSNGKLIFTESSRYAFEAMENATLDLVDFDKDGDLDLITTGRSFFSGKQFAFYESRDSSFFRIPTNIVPFDNGKMAFGDLNNDGFVDLIYSGLREGVGYISKVALFNPTSKSFEEQSQFIFGDFDNLNLEFGDFDGDNDLDILLFGKEKNTGNSLFRVYKNVQNESAQVQKAIKPNGKANAFRLNDISFAVNQQNSFQSNVNDIISQKNRTLVDEYIENQPPSIPNKLKEEVVRKVQNKFRVKFSWEMSSDDRTPADGLSYELRVGTKSGFSDVVISSSKENGFKLIPEEGNVGRNKSWEIDLLPGKYFWSVHSLDASLSGSQFASEKQFTVNSIGGICSAEIPVITVSNNKISICKGDSTRLISNVKGPLQWYKDDVLMQGVTDTAIKVTTPGMYKVINAVAGCSPVSSTAVVISQKVISTPQLTRSNTELVSSSVTGNQWYLDGSIIPGANTQKFTPVKSGLYTVKVILDNCESELSESYYYILTSVVNLDNGQYIKVYPNPVASDGLLTIDRNLNDLNDRLQVSILDITGKLIRTVALKSNQKVIKLPSSAGTYIIRLNWGKAGQQMFKVYKN